MKICMNAIGFTEVKKLKIAEGLIGFGALAVLGGLLLIRKSQMWYVGSTNDHFELIASTNRALDELINTD